MDPNSFTAATREYLEQAPLARRKALGQYFTPRDLRERLLEGLSLSPRPRILDPACGTGEFLLSARSRFPDAELVGLEIDEELAAIARRQVPDAEIRTIDALKEDPRPIFDAVVGNPPYLEFKPEPALRRRFSQVISGRPNTYALFVKLGLDWLKPSGRLAYVVPPSMNNGAYFRALRSFVVETCAVESLRREVSSDHFVDANQPVMLLRLHKGGHEEGRHLFRRGPFTLFCEEPSELERLFEGARTLAELGFTVKTGTVVWNQARDRLTDDPSDATRLIWAHDIGPDGELDFKGRPGKPGFVRDQRPLEGPAIVVNRVTGTGARARLRAARVPAGLRFVGENHVNVVRPSETGLFDSVDPAHRGEFNEAALAKIVESLCGERARKAVRLLTGNTQISSVELAHLVPI